MLHVQVVLLVIVQGFSVPLLANSRNDVHVQVVFLVTYSCLLMRDIVVLFCAHPVMLLRHAWSVCICFLLLEEEYW